MYNFNFEIVLAGVYDSESVYKNIVFTDKRIVKMFEIELPMEGGGISYIDNEECKTGSDVIICAKPGQIRRCRLPHKCSYIYLNADGGEVFETLSSFPSFLKTDSPKKYRTLFSDIITAFTFPFDGSSIFIAKKLTELIYDMQLDAVRIGEAGVIKNEIIERAAAYMDNHFTENITLDDIASKMNLSPVYFHRLFLKCTSTTPYKYMLNLKLDMAKKLLISTSCTLSEIAFKAGFSSQSYFGSVFKREVGKTPMQYRKDMYSRYPKF